jgi:hypothetical protein
MILTENKFYVNPNWNVPCELSEVPGPHMIELFDQNGYRLTHLEVLYGESNFQMSVAHRKEMTIKKDWFIQEEKTSGAVLNHAALFERKGYEGDALNQLKEWAKINNTLYKLIRYRSKWGIDFSMDYTDEYGNALEVLHYEFDGFDYSEIQEMKLKLEPLILSTDWEFAAKKLLLQKDKWHHLDFFAQSDYKCTFFGLGSERFKMVAWE